MKISYDVIVLTETWIASDHNFDYNIEGYKVYYKTGILNKCDGLCVFVKNCIDVDIVSHGQPEGANSLSMSLKIGQCNLFLVAVYRSPSAALQPFVDSLDKLCRKVRDLENNIVFVGDFNVNLLNNDKIVNDYISVFQSNGFKSYINKPTRINRNTNTKSCIDHIFVRNKNLPAAEIVGYILQTNITDHYSVALHLDMIRPTKTNPGLFSKIAKLDIHKLKEALKLEEWKDILDESQLDVDKLTDTFTHKLKYLLESNTKLIPLSKKKRPLKPWMSVGLVTSIRTRDKMHKQLLKEPFNVELKIKYKNYRNKLYSLINNAKISYYKNKLTQSRGNARNTWNCINEMLENKRTCVDPKIDPEVLNDFFVTVGESYANKIISGTNFTNNSSDNLYQNYQTPINTESFFLRPVTSNEIEEIIKQLKNNAAPGIDGISNFTVKLISPYISKPLERIINKIFEIGIFPKQWKIAKIKAIYKTGDRTKPDNYRPISLLSVFSKIAEKLIKYRLFDFIQKFCPIDQNQHGFQSGKNTQDAILKLVKLVINNFDVNKRTLVVFLDLAKAFDTVPHEQLLDVLERCGVRGTALNLFTNYLKDRVQLLQIDMKSDIKKLSNFGLPQGTVLSPLLYLIYVNGLFRLRIKNCDILAFADDTALIFTGITWEDVFRSAELGTQLVSIWFQRHILTINCKKYQIYHVLT